ncbi:MAG: electron transfer flavoprotein beta subunit/FixA family protein [Dehalobacterium sp.]
MVKIIACYKWVLDEADININDDLSVDLTKAKGKISDYDKNVIEVAVKAASAVSGKACGLTFGDAKAKLSLKDALSRGLEEAYYVNAEEAVQADGAVTARALTAAIKNIDEVGLIVCAEGASDTYQRQIAPRLGAMLDIPVITSVRELEIEDNTITAVRKLEDCQQTVKVEIPAVISVLPEICNPPIPGLKAVMSASKKPVTEYKAGDLDVDLTAKTTVTRLKGYKMNRKNIILSEGTASEKVKTLVDSLRKEGVL